MLIKIQRWTVAAPVLVLLVMGTVAVAQELTPMGAEKALREIPGCEVIPPER